MKIQFDIKYRPQIESGEYKVVTGDGRPVRIISWDKKVSDGRYEIVALVYIPEEDIEKVQLYCTDGTLVATYLNEKLKLVVVTPEPELTEFEEAVLELATRAKTSIVDIKIEAQTLLDLARKKLEPEVLKRLDEAYKNQDDVVYENGKRDGKAEALKDLPRWKLSNCPRSNLPSLYLTGDGAAIYKDGYEISISGLEKLPKEETNL